MNGFLFDIADEPKTGAADKALAHRADPQTSYDAAQQQTVLAALRQCDGATHAELGAFMGLHWLTPTRRLPELERAGLVRRGEPWICTVKGSKCCTWWLTEAGQQRGDQ
jgi:hypothetical protein